jgi:hypothetical protein
MEKSAESVKVTNDLNYRGRLTLDFLSFRFNAFETSKFGFEDTRGSHPVATPPRAGGVKV